MLVARVVSFAAAVLALAQGASAQGAPAATKFTIKVENISHGEVLKLSNGQTAPFVSAPVLWAVHTGSANPMFVAGQVDAGKGLETLAETGNPAPLAKPLNGAPRVIAVGADDRPVGSDAVQVRAGQARVARRLQDPRHLQMRANPDPRRRIVGSDI